MSQQQQPQQQPQPQPEPQPQQPPTITHPFNPALKAEITDIDGLVSMLDIIKQHANKLREVEFELREAITNLTEGDNQTRHVVTPTHKAKVTMPSSKFNNSMLKLIWNDPQFSDAVAPGLVETYIRITQLDIKRREVNKLRNTTGNELFERFKERLLACEQEAGGVAAVSVERVV